mmetsp:Transcript_123108/g.359465  ORF Transcript_123108/g.359465 Transcript_123108/m.359465 type:complete len:260 (-) Transcript_123108:1283-2062(-)
MGLNGVADASPRCDSRCPKLGNLFQAEFDATINAMHSCADAVLFSHNGAILDVHLRVGALVPHLRYLQHRISRELNHVGCTEPGIVQEDLLFDQELCHYRCLGHFTQVVYGTSSLRDQVEVMSEGLSILHEGMIGPCDSRVLKAVWSWHLLPSFHAHFDIRRQDIALRQQNVCLPDDKPFTGPPLLVVTMACRKVKAVLHADHGLRVFSHGELLQVVVGLEHHLASARSPQPFRFEPLNLHGRLAIRRTREVLLRVQGE